MICNDTDKALMMSIRINSLDLNGSVCDGPGLRAVLYVQGCQRECPGCHNPCAWDSNAGQTVSVRELAERIRVGAPTRRLTISGGEPLEQAVGVQALLDVLADFDLTLYTGHDLEDIPSSIMHRLRWVKVGSFDISRRTTVMPFVGSNNQQFLNAREVLAAQRGEVQT